MQTKRHRAGSILHSLGLLIRQAKRQPLTSVDQSSLWLLKRLGEGPCRLTELATLSHLDASTTSRHVTTLESRGLVAREADPADGRARVLMLTDAGRDTLRAALRERTDYLSAQLEGWDDDDITHLERLLKKLADQVSSKDTH